MKKEILLYFKTCLLAMLSMSAVAQVTHQVTVQDQAFIPSNISINVGDIVEWTNIDGFHNVNGTNATYPGNAESFGNNPGAAGWVYSHTFTAEGSNNYRCDVHTGMTGVVTVTAAFQCPGLNANIGDACDDGNANTSNDSVTADCICVGTLDGDCVPAPYPNNDPVYLQVISNSPTCCSTDWNTACESEYTTLAAFDCLALQANIGDSCDDGNTNTANDVVSSNCNCAGVLTTDCPNAPYPPDDLAFILTLADEPSCCQLWDGDCEDAYGDFLSEDDDAYLTFHVNPATSNNANTAVVRVYLHETGALFKQETVLINPIGYFGMDEDFPPGSYDIYIQFTGFLQLGVLDEPLSIGINHIELNNLIAGDLNGDNAINIQDVSILSLAFNTTASDPNFNPVADFNGDGGINILDVSVIGIGFEQAGATP